VSLEAERYRNLEREDTFVSASVMGQRGMWGMPPRTGPAFQSNQVSRIPPQPQNWDAGFSGREKIEFESIHLPDALAHGVSAQQAQRDFARVIASRRMPLNDDPYSN